MHCEFNVVKCWRTCLRIRLYVDMTDRMYSYMTILKIYSLKVIKNFPVIFILYTTSDINYLSSGILYDNPICQGKQYMYHNMSLGVGKPFLNAQEIKPILLLIIIVTLIHFLFTQTKFNSNIWSWLLLLMTNFWLC